MSRFPQFSKEWFEDMADDLERKKRNEEYCPPQDPPSDEAMVAAHAARAFEDAEKALILRLSGKMPEAEIGIYKASMCKYHDRVVGLVESPIERMMLPWLITIDVPKLRTKVIRTASPKDDAYDPGHGLTLIPQLSVGRHRLDFAMVLRNGRHTLIIDIECDGRQWHYMPADAARDRYLASLGIETIRTTGAEIHTSPQYAADRVATAIIRWL